MTHNWITWIGVLLVVTPILFALLKGLPNELEQMKYSVVSALRSLQLICAFLIGMWLLRSVLMQNTWSSQQVQWVQEQLHQSLIAWIVALGVSTFVLYGILSLIVGPLTGLLVAALHTLQGWATGLPSGLSRLFAAVLQTPKALVRLLVFVLAVHLGLPYLHNQTVATMAQDSHLYAWTDQEVIAPVLSSSLVKRLPVLGDKAHNWIHDISEEAVKNGPVGAKGFLTWNTRFDSNEEIDATAKSIVQGATTDREKANRLYRWIGSHVSYDDTKASEIEAGAFSTLTFGAIPTFETRTGVCSDYSSLMVAMGRAVGLKVKQEFGQAVLPTGGGPHAWNVVYMSDQKKWIPCDPTWEQSGNFFDNPDFYVTHRAEQQAG
ncbi:MAG: transglutaminase domain-containing protein [Tumebacillaceae bacterium]